jgi:hypothetical protein
MAKYIVIHGIKVDKNHANFVPETFGRLTTLGPKFALPKGKKGLQKYFQVCQCTCGAFAVYLRNYLVGGHTKSCGCLRGDTIKSINTLHGLADTREHAQWLGMLNRCHKPNNKAYPEYGGRGIRVCGRWREPNGQGFINFISDVGPRPSLQHSIDRIDNDGHYCPENCRWATREEQGRNKRNNRMLTAFGKTQCMADWLDEMDMDRSALNNRLRLGWSVEKALSYPMRSKHGKK